MPLDQSATHAVSQQPHSPRGQPRDQLPAHGGRILSAPRWYAVQSHPQAERWAGANLGRIGYVAYLPLIAVRVRDRHTPTITRITTTPLFTGYLFVLRAPSDPWTPIRYCAGVRDLVMFGADHPMPVTQGAVEALRATESQRALIPPPTATLAPGTAVAVSRGMLRGHRGVLVSTHAERAVVSLLLFGALQAVHVAAHDLTPAADLAA